MSIDDDDHALPAAVGDAKLDLTHEEALRATALVMAIRYHSDAVIKDGAMYQQKKLDGSNIEPTSTTLVLQWAIDFERYLRGDYAEMVDQLVGGDFTAWLEERVGEVKKSIFDDDPTGA